MGRKRFERLSRDERISLIFDLINAFKGIKTPYESAMLLNDLLTANEIRNLSIRLRIAKKLISGDKHKDIVFDLKTSTATVTKVRAWLDQGGDNLISVIKRLPIEYKIPKDLPPIPVEFQLPKVLLTVVQYSRAKGQRKSVEKLIEKTFEKESTNRQVQKYFDEYYKQRRSSKQ